MKKKEHWDATNLINTGAQYLMPFGQRSNGKSYQAKIRTLTDCYKNNVKMVYLRRYETHIKGYMVESYFGDMPIKKITNGNYDTVVCWKGSIFFAKLVDGKYEKGQEIGRYCALNIAGVYKSQTFIDYKHIIFEEFITDEIYLNDEPNKLLQFVSTVARDKKLTVWLIGNTLSRVCPYFDDWSLNIKEQKIGTIDIYHVHYEDTTVDIAVEYCEAVKSKNTMFFGNSAKQIMGGEWDVKNMPKLPQPKEFYDKVYEVLVRYKSFEFIIELLIDDSDGGIFCYVYPFTGKRKVERIITEEFSTNRFITNQLDPARPPEKKILWCFANSKICYSDNLTGTDFQNVGKQFKIC